MTLRILLAPSGFKESLGAEEVADCIAEGILRALPDARIQKAPLVDGGEGFAKALVAATGGTLHSVTVTGPVGQPVRAHYGFLGGAVSRTAVLNFLLKKSFLTSLMLTCRLLSILQQTRLRNSADWLPI